MANSLRIESFVISITHTSSSLSESPVRTIQENVEFGKIAGSFGASKFPCQFPFKRFQLVACLEWSATTGGRTSTSTDEQIGIVGMVSNFSCQIPKRNFSFLRTHNTRNAFNFRFRCVAKDGRAKYF